MSESYDFVVNRNVMRKIAEVESTIGGSNLDTYKTCAIEAMKSCFVEQNISAQYEDFQYLSFYMQIKQAIIDQNSNS
jgi:hypothetical protein